MKPVCGFGEVVKGRQPHLQWISPRVPQRLPDREQGRAQRYGTRAFQIEEKKESSTTWSGFTLDDYFRDPQGASIVIDIWLSPTRADRRRHDLILWGVWVE